MWATKSVEGLEAHWDTRGCRRLRSASLIAVMLGGVVLIEVFRWQPATSRPGWMPSVHLAAISWAISLLLLYELVDMAFAISKSVARSVTRYLQLYALVLVRDAFLKLDSFPEPIEITVERLGMVGIMAADAAGGIGLFVAAAVFARLQRHTPITVDAARGALFVTFKQVLVLALLATLVLLCGARVLDAAGIGSSLPVLDTYFTVLVFVDVLLAFISLAFTTSPAIVFRNFGFAFAAILLRFSLASPEYIRPALAVVGAAAAIAVTLAYNMSAEHSDGPPTSRKEAIKGQANTSVRDQMPDPPGLDP